MSVCRFLCGHLTFLAYCQECHVVTTLSLISEERISSFTPHNSPMRCRYYYYLLLADVETVGTERLSILLTC